MGYFTEDSPHPRGELLVKTSESVSGYNGNTEETSKAFDADGWYYFLKITNLTWTRFRTGDIVELLAPRKIRVIDRKKNIFKLSQVLEF